MTLPFLELFTASGRRERGARTELALRTRADRELDVGDVEREERRDRAEVELAAAAVVGVVVVTVSRVKARGGVVVDFVVSSREVVGVSDLGDDTNVSPSSSRASPMKRLTCSSAASRFFVLKKCTRRSRRPCTSIARVCSRPNLQRSCSLTPLMRAMGTR
jgi:hypothetical protein